MTYTPAFQLLQEDLLRTYVQVLHDTVPQFIGENNTQQLRKLILESILRMNCNDIIKQYTRAILAQLTKVIQNENEENAVLAIRIVIEHQRTFRMGCTQEIVEIVEFIKAVYREMPQHISSGHMFEQKNLRHCGIEDSVIESSLQNCYMPTIVYLPESSGDGAPRDSGYSLIPRASQSVKVLSELPMFSVVMCQFHRHHMLNELAEIISLMVQYCSLSIPDDQQSNISFSSVLADEFYFSQMRVLIFLGFIAARTVVFNVGEVISSKGTQIVQAIIKMLNHCPHENYAMRRELLGHLKSIFVSDLQTKFIPFIPKLFDETLMLGSGYSSVDFLRQTMYSMLADLVHHVRGRLSYNVLCCTVHAFTKSMFDSALQPTVQSMCIKVMMNLIESFVILEKNHVDQPCRDILFCLLENYVRKLKWLAQYQLPIILKKNASNIVNTAFLHTDKFISETYNISVIFSVSRASSVEFLCASQNDEADKLISSVKAVVEDPTSPLSSENDFDLLTWQDKNVKSLACSLPPPTKIGKTSVPEEILSQYWVAGIFPYQLHECKNMIRVLMQACKHAVHALKDTHITNYAISPDHEIKIIDQLFQYGLQCLDIYVICQVPNQISSAHQRLSSGLRSKEEKEVLELFASIFTLVNPSVFKKIISKRINYFIERLTSNYALQVICSSLLVNTVTSANFGDKLIQFLMKRLPDLADCTEKSFLWLKLFKIVFSSVGSKPAACAENERMLRPYLHKLVLRAIKLALRARDPINYFLLLRALFRSIGGGSYDLLYQTFLPLLPTLLHQLNRLQSNTHRAQMRELYIELCLTVPVRLSSLLPYLPLLMDPLVCALNGTCNLIQQGLRTLELCVDNLQPDYLYSHMVPVQAELIRGLWQCMSGQDKVAAEIAFRILGKFGAANRKVLIDPQNLAYRDNCEAASPAFKLVYQRSASAYVAYNQPSVDGAQTTIDYPLFFCELNISEVVKEALKHLRSPFLVDASFVMATAQSVPGGLRVSSLALRRHSFRIIKGVILSGLAPTKRGLLKNPHFKKQFTNKILSLRTKKENSFMTSFCCDDRSSRCFYRDALLGLFYATAAIIQDATSNVMDFFSMVIRHLTIQIVFEQYQEKASDDLDTNSRFIEYTVLIDTVLLALADPCKEVCQTSLIALKFIFETTVALLGSIDKAANSRLFQQILERLTNLCYNEPWSIRLGGCLGIKYILMNFPPAFIIRNIDVILCALFEVIMGLLEDVSSSAVDVAIATSHLLLKVCFKHSAICKSRKKAVECVVERIIENLQSPSEVLSRECHKLLTTLGNYTGFTLCELVTLHQSLLKKFIDNGMADFKRMSLDHQIAFEESITFIFSMQPVPLKFVFHKFPENNFISYILSICNATEKEIRNWPNYKPSTRFLAIIHRSEFTSRITDLRLSSIKALIACCIASCEDVKESLENDALVPYHKQILETLLKCLAEKNYKIQYTAFIALKEALMLPRLRSQLKRLDLESTMSVLSHSECHSQKHRALHLLYFIRLFPDIFPQTFCNKLLVTFHQFPDSNRNIILKTDVEIGQILLEVLAEFSSADARFVPFIISHVCRWEAVISFETSTSWRHPLIKYLIRFPSETLHFFVSRINICKEEHRELFKHVVKHEKATALRAKLMKNSSYILHILHGEALSENKSWMKCNVSIYQMEMLAMKLTISIGKHHYNWAEKGIGDIVIAIQALWNDRSFRTRYSSKDYLEGSRYDVPKLAALIMLRYFKANIDRIDIIFDLCYVFSSHYVGDFTFLRLFIEKEIVPKYPIEWRQNALKLVVEKFEKDPATARDPNVVKMLQYIVIPSLHYAFERYDADMVVGTPARPDDVDDNNLISLICQKVLDRNRFHMSDAMLIQLFHLGCLFVSNCPTHIHDFSQKDCRKQGNRLRILMLLGWPCLSSTSQDQTMKYMGHLLIANIINQFNINRKIVLQVFLSLLNATVIDPKEIIKRSLDILTPSVPLRMDDGHKQLLSIVKKTLVEDGHNVAQVYHCLSMIVRHYKIYYDVRHQMLQVILNGVQRLLMGQCTIEHRRVVIDVCEMIIKWEQWRLKQIEDLERRSEASKQSLSEANLAKCSSSQQQSSSSLVKNMDAENIHRPIDQSHVDHVVNMLLKLSSSSDYCTPSPNQHVLAVEQLGKRCYSLLRACLKSNLWGLTVNFKFAWVEKQMTVAAEAVTQQFREQNAVAHHLSVLQSSLDVIAHLVSILPPEVIVPNVKMLQRGIIACLNCQDNTVMRSFCQLIGKLFERTKCSPEGLLDLETINQYITRFINDTFNNYDKNQGQPMAGVFTAIHLLRTICFIQPAYIDKTCLSPFIKTVQKLVREHIISCTENKGHAVTELIIFSLELLRPRIHALSPDTRRNIGQCILAPLIDKTLFDRVIDIVIRIVDIMVRNGDENQLNQGVPLLIRLVETMELHKRHEKSGDLLKTLLETDESLRSKFFKLFDRQFPDNVCDRLYCILTSQNWAYMQQTFWIKHCIALLLSLIRNKHEHKMSSKIQQTVLVNCFTLWHTFEKTLDLEVFRRDHGGEHDGNNDAVFSSQNVTESKREDFSEHSGAQTLSEVNIPVCSSVTAHDLQIALIVEQEVQLLEMAGKFQAMEILPSYEELIHNSTELASKIWIQLFPSLWSNMSDFERTSLEAEIMPFLTSGSHLTQVDLPHSALAVFLEAIYHCQPRIFVHPNVLLYILIRHCAWHRGLLMLEEDASDISPFANNEALRQFSRVDRTNTQLVTLNNLIICYSVLSEFDQYYAVWKKRAYFNDTSKAIEYYNKGDFVKAEEILRNSIDAFSNRSSPGIINRQVHVTPALSFELREWQKLWIECERELGEWDALLLFGNAPVIREFNTVADVAWHLGEWDLLRSTLTEFEGCTRPDLYYKYNLYKAMLMNICLFENNEAEQDDLTTKTARDQITKELEEARDILVAQWKRLPDIVSLSHVNILQASNIIQEVHEASVLANQSEISGQTSLSSNPVLETKIVLKNWKSRSYSLSDPVSFFGDIYHWRIHHLSNFFNLLKSVDDHKLVSPQQKLLPVYSAAQSELMMARAARKAGLLDLAFNKLYRMHTLPVLPAVDAYQSVKELMKCLIQRASLPFVTKKEKHDILTDAFVLLQETSVRSFTRENLASFYALRGRILAELEKYRDANRSFQIAGSLQESVGSGYSVWFHWAQYLENQLDNENTEEAALSTGMGALSGLLEGVKVESEHKARKYCARLLWLMKKLCGYGKKVEGKMDELIEKYGKSIPSNNWLPWLPQLIDELKIRPSTAVAHIIESVGESNEQQVFYALAATMPLDFISNSISIATQPSENSENEPVSSQELLRDIMKKLFQHRPAEISSLCRLFNELNNVKEHWLEHTLRMMDLLKERLLKFAYANTSSISSAIIPTDLCTDINNWRCSLKNFDGFDDVTEDIKECARKMESDFDIHKARNSRLLSLISTIVKWTELLVQKFDGLQSKKLMRNMSPILASYSCRIANMEIFSGHFTEKSRAFSTVIYRFMPYYFVVRQGNVVSRRISFRALSGRVYYYYLNKCYDTNRTASLLHQLFALINHFLTKEKETCRRFLQLTVPHFAYIGNVSLMQCTNKINSLYSFEYILDAILTKNAEINSSIKLIQRFYDNISKSGAVTDQKKLKVFHHIISRDMLPVDSLSKWVTPRFENPTHLYIFRKQVALSMSLLSICEHVLHLSPARLHSLFINMNTGQTSCLDYCFRLEAETMKLKVDQIVPYRMSSNLHKFLALSLEGHYNCSMVAAVQCFRSQNISNYIHLFLWNTFARQTKLSVSEAVASSQSAVNQIENRLDDFFKVKSLAEYIATLTRTAYKEKNLARCNPCLHTWF
ncbi:unnamed protein product [Thelazia callipaeda]|uniref:FAT domain-containing protein n=1 Tax=Thelazia callipaeda TaxID=103827 RepID=A0A158RAL8_THECL|nr:unnamed protein product [Thelazia callipaeda]